MRLRCLRPAAQGTEKATANWAASMRSSATRCGCGVRKKGRTTSMVGARQGGASLSFVDSNILQLEEPPATPSLPRLPPLGRLFLEESSARSSSTSSTTSTSSSTATNDDGRLEGAPAGELLTGDARLLRVLLDLPVATQEEQLHKVHGRWCRISELVTVTAAHRIAYDACTELGEVIPDFSRILL